MTPDSIRVLIMAVLVSLGIDTVPPQPELPILVAWTWDSTAAVHWSVGETDSIISESPMLQHTIPERLQAKGERHIVRIDTTEIRPMPMPVVIPDYRVFDTLWSDEAER